MYIKLLDAKYLVINIYKKYYNLYVYIYKINIINMKVIR